MCSTNGFAVVIPMANEQEQFTPFVSALASVLDRLRMGRIYFIVDKVSQDNTLELCNMLSAQDSRFVTIWAPETKNVVDAYMRGYREAYNQGFELIIEMDAGLSHDPHAIPMFLRVLNEGNECALGAASSTVGPFGAPPLTGHSYLAGGHFWPTFCWEPKWPT